MVNGPTPPTQPLSLDWQRYANPQGQQPVQAANSFAPAPMQSYTPQSPGQASGLNFGGVNATPGDMGLGGYFNKNFGGAGGFSQVQPPTLPEDTGAAGMGWGDWANLALDGFGAYNQYKGLGIAEDRLDFEKSAFNKNYTQALKAYDTEQALRRERMASAAGKDWFVEE